MYRVYTFNTGFNSILNSELDVSMEDKRASCISKQLWKFPTYDQLWHISSRQMLFSCFSKCLNGFRRRI
ncbi:hypothetical protein MA16_Dca027642 [Dendrobium catenatum]|uniref:Uncharacterized protein n=1 Tax=Dendrobium catenatum TaxID=906689 RepID=A0A2I0WIE3_9ASPA|nr:hypothetical protein MA16_Dca027642 [Dendrobium catenatum]